MDKEKQRTTPQASMKRKSSLRGIMGGATLTRYHLANKYKKMRR